MDCFYGKGRISTDSISDEYIFVNNFGYTRQVDCNLCTKREKGRLDYQIIYIDKGYGHFLIQDKFQKVDKGKVVLLHPGEKNHYKFSSDSASDYYWIHFSGSGVANILAGLRLCGNVFEVGDFFEFRSTIDSMSRASATADFTTEAFVSSCIYMLLVKISKRVYVKESSIHAILARMQNEKLSTLTNSDYAKMCNLSEYHFLRKFKKITGTTPHRYLAEITVNKAVELLRDTNLNVSEIAELLGFEDSLYFSRFFKKETGFSPTNYIKRIAM